MEPKIIKPSALLREKVKAFRRVRRAALAWGIEPYSLERFIKGQGGITMTTAAKLSARTGLSLDQLFDQT